MPNEVTLTIHKHQLAVLQSTSLSCFLVGGIGCGKTRTLAYECIQWANEEPPLSPGLIAAPTHNQLDKATIPQIKGNLEECGIQFVHGCKPPKTWNVPLTQRYNDFENILTLATGHCFVMISLDEPENARGPEFGLILLDEAAQLPDDRAYKILLGRLRSPSAKRPRIRGATTPKGYNWVYEYFEDPDTRRPNHEQVNATTYDNMAFLPQHYRELIECYDEQTLEQEVMGRYVMPGESRLYSEFDPNRHVRGWRYVEGMELHVGCDFNVAPMCWVISQVTPNREGHPVFNVFDTIWIEREATTADACGELRARYPNHSIYVYPDTSCKRRTTSGLGVFSDYELLKESGFEVIMPPNYKNPFVQDRVELVQKALREERLLVDPCCKELIHSFVNTRSLHGMRKPVKSYRKGADDKVPIGEHPTDAAGYLVWNYMNRGRIIRYNW